MLPRTLGRILLSVWALTVVACGGGGGGGQTACQTVAECETGQICAGAQCAPCTASVQCEADYGLGATCNAGICQAAACPAGDLGCPCQPDQTCTQGECQDGVCTEQTCPEGDIGCPCLPDQTCSAGECVSDTCTDCERGDADCVCFYNGTCATGLRCNATYLCELCPAGAQSCPCRNGDTCDGEFVCREGVCVTNPCPEGTDGCPCRTGQACDDGLTCSPAGLCAPCSNDIEGCPCEAGVCQNDLVCDEEESVCRPAVLCAELTCVPHQQCQQDDGFDAACMPGCEPGWTWNPDSAACDEVIVANCEPGAAGSILAQCDAANRDCVPSADSALCGPCHDFFTDENGALASCRPVQTCAELGCEENHRACNAETQTNDARCEGCLDFFTDLGGTLPQCRAVLICDEIGCDARHRSCTAATAATDAVCADCLAGYVDEGGTLEDCRPTLTCADLSCAELFRDCQPETETADAHCADCVAGYIATEESGDACRAVLTCTDLDCTSLHRACQPETATADAYCGDCLDGYVPQDELCVQTPEANCNSGAPGNILSQCDALFRQCVDPPDAPAYCGDCVAGTVVDPNDPERCISSLTCGDTTCTQDEFCIADDSGEPRCMVSPCPPGQAFSAWIDECTTCVVACGDDAGETGRIWPYTLQGTTSCICETELGYYWEEGLNRAAKPCDVDGDGWVRDAARGPLSSSDPAMVQNARCDLRTIDRFVLKNEMGQRLEIYLCDGDEPFRRQDEGPCDLVSPLDLFETVRNDDQLELDQDSLAPPYRQDVGGTSVGRRLRAGEINPLTKACTIAGDFNDNGLSDIGEWHGMPVDGLSDDEMVFVNFSYYTELHDSYYEAAGESTFGRYVIQERSRCDTAAFPLHGGQGDEVYWRECTRSRDVAYDPSDGPEGPEFGLDFARWSCDAQTGGCPIAPPPTDALPAAAAPLHGQCQVPLPPVDNECGQADNPWLCVQNADGTLGVWRGMSHHSQFRCVTVDAGTSDEVPIVDPLEFEPADGHYRLERCHVACPEGDEECESDCADPAGCTTSTRPPSAGANPSSPVIACELVEAPAVGDIGFAVVKYLGPGEYQRGCIDEWAPTGVSGNPNGSEDPEIIPWRSLCPGWAFDPNSTIGQGNQFAFGELQCGCGNNFGGTGCTVGCPNEQLHLSQGYIATPRQGFWLCGEFVASGYETLDSQYGPALVSETAATGSWVLRAQVPASMGGGQPLCEHAEQCECPVGETCETGFVIR